MAVLSAIFCVHLNPNLSYIIHPDVYQKYAMGGMLTQLREGVEQVVWKLNEAQLKYLVKEQELLAAYKGLNHFHAIIYGC